MGAEIPHFCRRITVGGRGQANIHHPTRKVPVARSNEWAARCRLCFAVAVTAAAAATAAAAIALEDCPIVVPRGIVTYIARRY